MFEQRTLEGTDEVLRTQRNATENFVICDLPGFAAFADRLPSEKRGAGKEGSQWYGGMTYDQSVAAVRCGDTAGVAASDKLLSEMESLMPVSQSWRTFNSVVGMCPNVPQYLGGQSVQHEAETALHDRNRSFVDLRRTGCQRGHRREDLP